jgi:hypothetical protein
LVSCVIRLTSIPNSRTSEPLLRLREVAQDLATLV